MRSPIRLVFTWLSTARGGAEESLRVLASALASRYSLGVDVVIWNQGNRAPAPAHGAVSWHEPRDRAEYLATLSRRLKRAGQETVLFSNHRTFALDVALGKRYGARCAVIVRGLVCPGASIRVIPSASGDGLSMVPWENLDWPRLSQADAIVAVSDAAAGSLRPFLLFPEKIRRIYNPVSDDWFIQDLSELTVRTHVKRFLMASRLVGWKSVGVGVEAFAKLAQQCPSVTLDIIGDGPEERSLQRSAARHGMESRILFHGWQADPLRWYAQSDCLVQPSSLEGFGRVVAEANSRGLVAVGPQSGGPGELIIDGYTGLTFVKDSADSCHAALKGVMSLSFEERRQISIRAWLRSKALFNPRAVAEEYADLVNELIRKNPRE